MHIQNYWGGTDMVFQCLIDEKRAKTFKRAIKNCVKKGDVVVDLGSGTGILALFAAQSGASKVYAVENDPVFFSSLEKTIRLNGFENKIMLLKGDARTIKIPEKVDVVTCEMIATGLIDEMQIPAINNIQKYCKKTTKILPLYMENFVEVVESKSNFYGKNFYCIQYEYPWQTGSKSKSMSKKHMYLSVNFSKESKKNTVDKIIKIKITKDGKINGIKITNLSYFPDKTTLGSTAAYCMPLILPIEEKRVNKNQIVSINLEYELCGGMENCKYFIDY